MRAIRCWQTTTAHVLWLCARGIWSVAAAISVSFMMSGCVELQPYRTSVPPLRDNSSCGPDSTTGSPDCTEQATESNLKYALHVVEFDDEGWPFDDQRGNELAQIDSAVRRIKAELDQPYNCVRLFVYVHGWRHNAKSDDSNVIHFREFLAKVSDASRQASAAGQDACADPAVAGIESSRKPMGQRSASKPLPSQVRTVGLYIGWRGKSVQEAIAYLSFWDRKNTAERVAQGSVRELFARLHALANYAPTPGKARTQAQTSAQLRTYVIGHSFGASVAFRALSQSLVDGFAEDLDADANGELPSVARFVDMVVLVNPAIEAARFDPVYRAAMKVKSHCEVTDPSPALCDRPRYQAPVLAIFTSEGDQATKIAFPLGASLSNAFENTRTPRQRQSIVQTIGWDDNYATHVLSETGECTGSTANPFDPATSPLRYNAPGWSWCFTTPSGSLLLTHLARPAAPPVYNGPLWNVRVPITVMRDHNDTWNAKFRDLLLHLFTHERTFTKII